MIGVQRGNQARRRAKARRPESAPLLKDLNNFVFTDTPIDEGQVRELAISAFLDAKRNVIFIGGTGTGKTHLCIAVASAVIRARARARG